MHKYIKYVKPMKITTIKSKVFELELINLVSTFLFEFPFFKYLFVSYRQAFLLAAHLVLKLIVWTPTSVNFKGKLKPLYLRLALRSFPRILHR